MYIRSLRVGHMYMYAILQKMPLCRKHQPHLYSCVVIIGGEDKLISDISGLGYGLAKLHCGGGSSLLQLSVGSLQSIA